jgi:hypothetical protein
MIPRQKTVVKATNASRWTTMPPELLAPRTVHLWENGFASKRHLTIYKISCRQPAVTSTPGK